MRNHSRKSLRLGHTDDPLDPDDVVAIRLRLEILQAAAEVVFHSLAVLAQVRARFVQELLSHVHQVHGAEEGQEKTLGDAADSCAAVQGTAWSRLTFAFLGTGEYIVYTWFEKESNQTTKNRSKILLTESLTEMCLGCV